MIRRSRDYNVSDDEVCERLAANLTSILEARHMSRRDLARITGDSVASIARVAAGTHACSVCMAYRIAEGLRIPVDRLLSRQD